MGEKRLSWWDVAKALLSVAVLAFVGWSFYNDLSRLPSSDKPIRERFRVGWLALSAVLYLAGLGLSGMFWVRLLGHLNAHPGWYRGLRAYFVSQLGKYVPGKALALVLRVGMVRSEKTPAATAALAAFYEVLTTMAVGSLLALFLTPFVVPADAAGIDWEALRAFNVTAPHDPTRGETALIALAMLVATALPLTPWLFNRLAAGATRPFGMTTPPPVRLRYPAEGVPIIGPCWLLFGLALSCGLAALPEVDLPWTPATLGWLTVCMAIAYVGGFIVPVPGGLGAREFFLTLLLVPVLLRHGTPAASARPVVSLVVLLLRLAWTVGEVIVAGGLYLVPPPRGAT